MSTVLLRTVLLLGIALAVVPGAADTLEEASLTPVAVPASVWRVEGGADPGSGFLVDASGLVMTSADLVGRSDHPRVTVAANRVYAAKLLLSDRAAGTAFLKVNPRAVFDLHPVTLASAEPKAGLPARGDSVVALGYSRNGSISTIHEVVRRATARAVCFDTPLPRTSRGGPVLNSQGEIIGISFTPSRSRKRRVGACAVPLRLATRGLAEARGKSAEAEPLLEKSLTVLSEDVYPIALARKLAGKSMDIQAYRTRVGKVQVEVLTPPVLQWLGEHSDPFYVPKEDFHRPEKHRGSFEPEVIVQVVPDLRWSAGSGWRVSGAVVGNAAMYSAYAAVVLFGLLVGEEPPGPPPAYVPRAAYRFKRDFGGMQLIRDGKEVPPLEAERECGIHKVRMRKTPEGESKIRKIRGCYGIYRFPPEAFRPGGRLEIRVFEGAKPDESAPAPVPRELADRVWSDFRPYFEGLAEMDREPGTDTQPVPP